MYDSAMIEETLGADAVTYAQNKNRGGRSSAKGRDFETSYGAYRIALAAAEAHANGEDGTKITFHDQVPCFVDDFIVGRAAGRTLEQLKSGGASWNAGDHPLSDDFRMQRRLDSALGVTAAYRLVVSDEGQRAALTASRPDDISEVSVLAFPEGLRDVELISRLADLSDALTELSPRPPERVVREQVWRMVLGTWAGSKGDQSLEELINQAAHGPGGVVAPLKPPYAMPADAKKVLDNVPGLRFYIHKNFFGFEWRDGIMRGNAEYHCHTVEFASFVDELVRVAPTDFLGFFDVLKAHV